jgi:hypothetical protein
LRRAAVHELRAIAGPVHLWESYGRMKGVCGFTPPRLRDWLQNKAQQYFETTGRKPFRLHNLRGSAMSRARSAGITWDDAAIAFGCTPETMKKFYVALDETKISDKVFDAIE